MHFYQNHMVLNKENEKKNKQRGAFLLKLQGLNKEKLKNPKEPPKTLQNPKKTWAVFFKRVFSHPEKDFTFPLFKC